jgi:signal transduction histidine kinase
MATQELPADPDVAPPGVRVMVVDDDPRIRRTIASAMSRVGFHVLSADDGAPALVLAEHTPPDLAIVDFNMPMPGTDLVRTLKATLGRTVWVSVLTGEDDEDIRAQCFAAGADDVLAKPVKIPELRRRMLTAARTQQAFVEARLAQERADRRLAYGAEAAAMLAHDLNNGLAVALSNISYVNESVQVGQDETQALRATLAALRKMSGLVANFVDIARFEDAAVQPSSTMTNLRALIEEVVAVHSPTTVGPRFEITCEPELAGFCDAALIERVLHNLVGNATRYVRKDGTIRVIAAGNAEGACEVQVFNTGPCVPEHLRQKLFGKYAKGTQGKRGFGLYFCRLACEAHGGTIEYVPSDAGSAFVFKLPGRS